MREAIVKELVGAVKEMAGNGYSVTAQETTKNNGGKDVRHRNQKARRNGCPKTLCGWNRRQSGGWFHDS